MNDQAVTNWQERLVQDAKAVAVNERPQTSNISLRSGIMNINGAAIPGNKLKAVAVAYSFERTLYTQAFDPNTIVPPDCFALSLTGIDMVPHEASSDMQNPDCATCPQNQWQDNPKKPGRKFKPCKERRRVILIPADSIKEGQVAKAEMAVLGIPVTSIKHWANFVNLCATAYERPPWSVLAEVSVTPHMQNQFEVKWEVVGQVNDALLGEVASLIPQAQALALTPYEPQTSNKDAEEAAQTAIPEGAAGGKKKKY